MRARRRYWLSDGSQEREAALSALTLDCPFCAAPLTSAATAILGVGTHCGCPAVVVRRSEPEVVPPPAGVMASAFREIRQRLEQAIVGHTDVLQRLALSGARHVHMGGTQRLLLVGPSGSGKTTVSVALAAALDCPALVWDVSTSSESGWAGVDAGGALAELYQQCDRNLEIMSRSVTVLDELDKLACRDATGTVRSHRQGQQKSLLGWLGGGAPLRFAENGDRGQAVAVSTDDMLVVGSGVFEGLAPDAGPAGLVALGFSTEFVSRFPLVLRLKPLSPEHLVPIYRQAVADAVSAAKDFGFHIEVDVAVLAYVARAVAAAGEEVTPRAGMGWLQSAVDTAVLRLLELSARPGTRYQVRPDDVPVPAALRSRGL
jgi:ATP-dependent protease Clp ATPase subunit